MTTQTTIMDTQGWTYLSLPNYGTLCRYLVRSDVWERLEAHCLNCGYHPDEHNCDAIDCEDYVAAPFTDGGFTKTEITRFLPNNLKSIEWTGEVIHTATGQVVPLREWTEEERDDDWEDDQDCCLYLKRTTTTADEEAEGDHLEIYDICEWCRGVMDKEYPRSDRPLLLEQNYDDFLATPQDCPRCEYERQECLQDQDKDELNSAIDASGNCFHA